MAEVAYVAKFPLCDIHKYERNTEVPAAYDAKTSAGPWASLCGSCFITHGVGLGVGKGQRYVLLSTTENPPGEETS